MIHKELDIKLTFTSFANLGKFQKLRPEKFIAFAF